MLLGRTAATIRQDIVRFRECAPANTTKMPGTENFAPPRVIAERDFPREFPSFVASVAANYERIFSFSCLISRHGCKKLVSLIMSFFEQFRLACIAFGKSSGHLVYTLYTV